jgi:hypothetical protein
MALVQMETSRTSKIQTGKATAKRDAKLSHDEITKLVVSLPSISRRSKRQMYALPIINAGRTPSPQSRTTLYANRTRRAACEETIVIQAF